MVVFHVGKTFFRENSPYRLFQVSLKCCSLDKSIRGQGDALILQHRGKLYPKCDAKLFIGIASISRKNHSIFPFK
jgi:hypothetical protein